MDAGIFLGMKYNKMTISLQEACDEIGICKGTAHNKLCTGEFPIPTRKEGRHVVVDVRDLGTYIDTRRAEAAKTHKARQACPA